MKQDRGQTSFSQGLKFQNAMRNADRALSEADSAIHSLKENLDYYTEEQAEEFILDAIGAMQQAQEAIAQNAALSWTIRKPFVKELQNGIDAIKGTRPDVMKAIGVLTRVRKIERL